MRLVGACSGSDRVTALIAELVEHPHEWCRTCSAEEPGNGVGGQKGIYRYGGPVQDLVGVENTNCSDSEANGTVPTPNPTSPAAR